MKKFFLVLFLLLALIQSSNSQTADLNKLDCEPCFRGKPRPNCCSFIILESGLMFDLARGGYPEDKEGFVFTADFGLMFNNKSSKAFGGTIHLAADDDGTRFGIGPRYRIWLGPKTALDLSPRLMFGGSDNSVHRKFPGFSFSASYSLSDLISIDSYFQIIPYELTTTSFYTPPPPGPVVPQKEKGTETGLYLGISGRSYLAPVVPLALAIIIAATFDFNWGS
ncbi:MAG TPA: hypothetical protein VHP63_05680 [candidate division Zixibacteria bacterium]|nr:hypothetical protein [candidate division Zixibacteria bacterium]